MLGGWIKIKWIGSFRHTKMLTMLSDEAIELMKFQIQKHDKILKLK
jgi:hypothetical protein